LIEELPQRDEPAEGTVLGLHPHADGGLRGPAEAVLAEKQVSALFRTMGLLGTDDKPTRA
jgi:hypothetical protein